MVSVPSCFSFTTRHKGSSLHHPLDESNLLPHEGMGCTNLTHSPTASVKNPSLLRAMTATSSPAVTALAPCVCNLEHMYFSQDYKCLHRCTENTLSWTFFLLKYIKFAQDHKHGSHQGVWQFITAKENMISLIPASSHLLPPGMVLQRGERHCPSFAPHCPLTCNLNPKSGNPSLHNKGYCQNLELS